MKKLITFKETIKRLNITRRALYYWIENGTAPDYEQQYGKYLFYEDSVEKVRKRRENTPH